MGINIDEQSYIKVRKKIAYDCKGLNLETGIYESKHATKLIRDIQGITIPRFEEEINKFDKIELHKELVSILAYHMHNKHISMKRFSLSGNQYLSVLIVLGDFYSPQGNWCFVTAVYLPLLSVYR